MASFSAHLVERPAVRTFAHGGHESRRDIMGYRHWGKEDTSEAGHDRGGGRSWDTPPTRKRPDRRTRKGKNGELN